MGSECSADPTGKEDVSILRVEPQLVVVRVYNQPTDREGLHKQIIVPDFGSVETVELKTQARRNLGVHQLRLGHNSVGSGV